MTAIDRFEARLPELMTELAQPATPDYVNDLLRQTARTRQRPAWSALERWLPMGTVARTVMPVRSLPWRPILIAVLVLLLAVASVLFYAGSSEKLPAPFGPARNGVLLTSAANGDILAFDPATGKSTPVLVGGGAAVTFSSNGQSFYFDKSTTDAPEMWVANADGSGSHKVWSGPASTTWIEWSQDGKRLVIAEHPTTSGTTVHLVDVASGVDTSAAFDKRFTAVAQPYGSRSLLLAEETEGQPLVFYLSNDDGTNLRPLPAVAPAGFPSLSPDGTRIAYASWEDGRAKQGILHVLNLATGADKPVTSGTSIWLSPGFSPDGTQLAALRFVPSTQVYDVGIVTLDSGKAPVALGTQHDATDGSGAAFSFSPDGAKLIIRYADDGSAWLFDVAGGPGQPLAGITTEFFSWQRAGQ